MQPLYLTEAFVKSIELDDGALKITAHEKADTWFPLQRLSRIIVMGNMQWSSGALTACMQNGIPVSFGNSGGQYCGIALGECQNPQTLQQDILEFFSYEQGRYLLDNWFKAQHNRTIIKIRRRFHLDKSLTNTQGIHNKLNEFICLKYNYIYWQESIEKLSPMMAAHLAIIMQSYGFNLAIMQPATNMPGLHTLLIKLMEWEFWELAANGHLPKGKQHKNITKYYQRHQKRIEKKSMYWLGKLWNRMNELHYEPIE